MNRVQGSDGSPRAFAQSFEDKKGLPASAQS